jgi:LmbE family N-acetylglucosaminyl deacetylase
MKPKILIIEPHSDDAMIGMGGYLLRFREQFDFHFLLLTRSDIVLNHTGLVKKETRADEYKDFVEFFSGHWITHLSADSSVQLPLDCDGSLYAYNYSKLVRIIETVIDEVRPEKLFCCWPSFHQDHSTAYRATISATRPTAGYCPKEIFFYENPTYVHEAPSDFPVRPTYFVELDHSTLMSKLSAIQSLFPSQSRETGNVLSANGIEAWARYRGIEARTEYAEAFFCLRQII